MSIVLGVVGCSSAKKNTELDQVCGPLPQTETQPKTIEELPGPQPLPSPSPSATPTLDEYGPIAQVKAESGITIIFGRFSKTPASVMGAIRQLEQEGIPIKKIVAVETASIVIGVHVASKSQSKADWDMTQIYKELEKKEKKDLQKKLSQIFSGKGVARSQLEFHIASNASSGWNLSEGGVFSDRISQAIQGCGWVDTVTEPCEKPITKDQYLELIKKMNPSNQIVPVLVIQKEVPTDKQDTGVFFVQMPEAVEGELDTASRSKHLLYGKKLIKQEAEKIKAWIKEIKEKNGQS